MDSFGSLDDATQAAIREAQRQRKQARLQAKKQKQQQKPTAAAAEASNVEDYPTLITQEAYFDACSGGRFRDPKLPPCDEALALLRDTRERVDDLLTRCDAWNDEHGLPEQHERVTFYAGQSVREAWTPGSQDGEG